MVWLIINQPDEKSWSVFFFAPFARHERHQFYSLVVQRCSVDFIDMRSSFRAERTAANHSWPHGYIATSCVVSFRLRLSQLNPDLARDAVRDRAAAEFGKPHMEITKTEGKLLGKAGSDDKFWHPKCAEMWEETLGELLKSHWKVS